MTKSETDTPVVDAPSSELSSSARPMELEYLDTREAAALLRLSPRTLERMRVDGAGPKYFKAGGGIRSKVLYRREELRAFVEGVQFGSTSEYGKAVRK